MWKRSGEEIVWGELIPYPVWVCRVRGVWDNKEEDTRIYYVRYVPMVLYCSTSMGSVVLPVVGISTKYVQQQQYSSGTRYLATYFLSPRTTRESRSRGKRGLLLTCCCRVYGWLRRGLRVQGLRSAIAATSCTWLNMAVVVLVFVVLGVTYAPGMTRYPWCKK